MPPYRSAIYPPAKRGYPYVVVTLDGEKVLSAEGARTLLEAQALLKDAKHLNSSRQKLDERFGRSEG